MLTNTLNKTARLARRRIEYPIIEFFRARAEETHPNEIEVEMCRLFEVDRRDPSARESARVEISFALSRLHQLQLVVLYGLGNYLASQAGAIINERQFCEASDVLTKAHVREYFEKRRACFEYAD